MTFWEYLTNRRMLRLAERLADYGMSAEDVTLLLASVEMPGNLVKPARWR
jgi:hypothetical protein